MVSFNEIQKMIDGKWFIKGICFEGDELPLNFDVEIACGSEIKEVDTGKTYFYFRYEWSNNGSTGTSFPLSWINKDVLDFSGKQYKYIYPTSIEELQQLVETYNIWVLTGIKYSDKLLPNFTPQVADFNDTSWIQQALGNIILCAPDINDTIYWTVTYYNIHGDGGYNTFIDSETVEYGMCPSNVPDGYDRWTDENGDPIDPWNVNIYFDRGFYGEPVGEENEPEPEHDCAANGHVYEKGLCIYCGKPDPGGDPGDDSGVMLNGGILDEGFNEITLQADVTTRYDFTPSSSGTYRISSYFMPRDVRCVLRNSESEEAITSEDDIGEGDFDFYFDCILEANITYLLDIYLYPDGEEDHSSAAGSISIVYNSEDVPGEENVSNYTIYNYDANDPLDFTQFIPEPGEGEGPVCWEWVDNDDIWHIATDTSNINVDYDTTFYGFYCDDPNAVFSVKYTDDTEENPIIAEYNNIPAGTVIGTTYYPYSEEGEWEGPLPTRGWITGAQIKNIPVYRNYSFEVPGP